MKKILLVFILQFSIFYLQSTSAQVVCIFCYDQNDSISHGVNNLLLNGGFEAPSCTSGSFCPLSTYYMCDIPNWTCTGGGTSTYAQVFDVAGAWYGSFLSEIIEGTYAVYMGNFYCDACSPNMSDTSCLINVDCTVTGIPAGYPFNPDPTYGGSTGVSIEQTVNGLMPGNTYVLEFWAGGEYDGVTPLGLFAVDVGFGYTFLRDKATNIGDIGTRYIIEFNAVSTSHTIKFTNWGHIGNSATELVLDDVKLYTLADLDTSVAPCVGANINALFNAPHHICPGTCTNFTNLSTNATSYQWAFPGATPSVSTDADPTNICYNTPGNYAVTLIASNTTQSDTLTLNNYINVYPYPPPQGIAQSGDTLIANQGAVSYQWYHGGNLIPGATDYFYVATEGGDYNVVATDANNCEVEAAIFDVVAGIGAAVSSGSMQLKIYPNPVADKCTIHNSQFTMGAAVTITVFNILGVVVQSELRNKKAEMSVDVSSLPSGAYWLEVSSDEKIGRTTFVKQ